jgi:hypothetical protein
MLPVHCMQLLLAIPQFIPTASYMNLKQFFKIDVGDWTQGHMLGKSFTTELDSYPKTNTLNQSHVVQSKLYRPKR